MTKCDMYMGNYLCCKVKSSVKDLSQATNSLSIFLFFITAILLWVRIPERESQLYKNVPLMKKVTTNTNFKIAQTGYGLIYTYQFL